MTRGEIVAMSLPDKATFSMVGLSPVFCRACEQKDVATPKPAVIESPPQTMLGSCLYASADRSSNFRGRWQSFCHIGKQTEPLADLA